MQGPLLTIIPKLSPQISVIVTLYKGITQQSYDRVNYLAGSGSGGGGGVRDAVAEPAQQLGADGAVPRVRGQGQRAALRHLHLRGVSTCNMSRI